MENKDILFKAASGYNCICTQQLTSSGGFSINRVSEAEDILEEFKLNPHANVTLGVPIVTNKCGQNFFVFHSWGKKLACPGSLSVH